MGRWTTPAKRGSQCFESITLGNRPFVISPPPGKVRVASFPFQKNGRTNTMRRTRELISCAVATIICVTASNFATAQCAQSWYVATISCNTQFCNSQVGQHLPQGSGPYGVYYGCTTVSCCGVNYPTCYSLNFNCTGSGSLADPAIRQHLLELAKSQDIMVSSCKGEYRPLTIALIEEPSPKPAQLFVPVQRKSWLIGRGGL